MTTEENDVGVGSREEHAALVITAQDVFEQCSLQLTSYAYVNNEYTLESISVGNNSLWKSPEPWSGPAGKEPGSFRAMRCYRERATVFSWKPLQQKREHRYLCR